MNTPTIQGLNAFYYYKDLDKAWAFYRDVLGLETVLDYGFAKMVRLGSSVFLTLVDVAYGMHALDEPQSVAFALVTEQVEAWYDYLRGVGVAIHRELNKKDGAAHDGFIILDPEGYYVEIERFNPHRENVALLPILNDLPSLYSHGGNRPGDLAVKTAVYWTYYRDLLAAARFYESFFDVPLLVDQGWARIYQISPGGFLGLVDGEKGMHRASDKKRVTLSFITNELKAWFERASEDATMALRQGGLAQESEQVDLFVGFDPEGYFLEFDQFRITGENGRLHTLINK